VSVPFISTLSTPIASISIRPIGSPFSTCSSNSFASTRICSSSGRSAMSAATDSPNSAAISSRRSSARLC
jgi:hypothetical protein